MLSTTLHVLKVIIIFLSLYLYFVLSTTLHVTILKKSSDGEEAEHSGEAFDNKWICQQDFDEDQDCFSSFQLFSRHHFHMRSTPAQEADQCNRSAGSEKTKMALQVLPYYDQPAEDGDYLV